jgi:uncharacterized membrane protein HdeD (DUF308 family)
MNEFLKELGVILGTNVLAAVVVVLGAYYGVIGIVSVLSSVRDHRLNLSALEAEKRRYEILKLRYEIDALKKQHSLESVSIEVQARYSPGLPESPRPHVVERLRAAIQAVGVSVVSRHPAFGYIGLYIAHLVLRACALAFLILLAMFQMFGGPTVHWDNSLPLAILLAMGFLASNAIVRIATKARLRDPIGGWSYAAACLLGVLLYITGWHPQAL